MHFFVHFLLLSNSILFNNTLFTLSLLVQLSALYAYQGWKNRWGCKTQVFHSRLFDTTSVKRLGHRRTRMEGNGWGKKFENYINICVIWKLCLLCSGNWDTAFFRLEYVPMLCAQVISLFYSLYVTLVFALIFSCCV